MLLAHCDVLSHCDVTLWHCDTFVTLWHFTMVIWRIPDHLEVLWDILIFFGPLCIFRAFGTLWRFVTLWHLSHFVTLFNGHLMHSWQFGCPTRHFNLFRYLLSFFVTFYFLRCAPTFRRQTQSFQTKSSTWSNSNVISSAVMVFISSFHSDASDEVTEVHPCKFRKWGYLKCLLIWEPEWKKCVDIDHSLLWSLSAYNFQLG